MITSLGSCLLLHRNLRPMQQKRSARIALRRGASATHRRRRILQSRIFSCQYFTQKTGSDPYVNRCPLAESIYIWGVSPVLWFPVMEYSTHSATLTA